VPPDDDDAARRAAKGRPAERVSYAGFPTRHLAPAPPRPLPEEPTRPDAPLARGFTPAAPTLRPAPELDTLPPGPPMARPPLHAPHGRSGSTLVGVAPPPPRIDSASLPPVSFSKKGVRLSWSALKPFLPWIGLVFFGSGGFVTGAWAGFKAMIFTIAAISSSATHAREDVVKVREDEAAYESRIDAQVSKLVNAWKVEAEANRAERATCEGKLRGLTGDLEDVKKSLPKIQGLAKGK
jgi:hypothetical protein